MLYILPRVVLQVKASLYYKTINNKNKKTYFILPRGGCLFLGGGRSSLRVGGGLAPRSPSPRAQPRAGGSSAFYWCPQLPPGGRQLFFFGLASTLRTSLCSAAPSERSGALTPPPPGRARAAARSAAPPSPPSPGGCCRRDAWAAAGGEEKAPETGPGGCPTHPTAPP